MPPTRKPPMKWPSGHLGVEESHAALAEYFKDGAEDSYDTRVRIVAEYYRNRGNFSEACRAVGVRYNVARDWRTKDPEFATALAQVDAILAERVHQQFIDRVLDPTEKNPVWKIFYLKNNDPRYAEKAKAKNIQINITDETFKKPKALAKAVTTEVVGELE